MQEKKILWIYLTICHAFQFVSYLYNCSSVCLCVSGELMGVLLILVWKMIGTALIGGLH